MKEEILLEPDEAFYRGSQMAASEKAKRLNPKEYLEEGEKDHE